nr:hypothetical protein [uncultured Nitrososphaera sp.]
MSNQGTSPSTGKSWSPDYKPPYLRNHLQALANELDLHPKEVETIILRDFFDRYYSQPCKHPASKVQYSRPKLNRATGKEESKPYCIVCWTRLEAYQAGGKTIYRAVKTFLDEADDSMKSTWSPQAVVADGLQPDYH